MFDRVSSSTFLFPAKSLFSFKLSKHLFEKTKAQKSTTLTFLKYVLPLFVPKLSRDLPDVTSKCITITFRRIANLLGKTLCSHFRSVQPGDSLLF